MNPRVLRPGGWFGSDVLDCAAFGLLHRRNEVRPRLIRLDELYDPPDSLPLDRAPLTNAPDRGPLVRFRLRKQSAAP